MTVVFLLANVLRRKVGIIRKIASDSRSGGAHHADFSSGAL